MCGVGIDERHGHVADTHGRRLLCVCRPCHLLFDRPGAGGGRYRGVGTDVRVLADAALDPGAWDELQVPVDLVFVLTQTPTPADDPDADTDPTQAGPGAVPQAFYPGPGGATESLLGLDWWGRLVEANPALDTVETDVEAVLLRRDDTGVSCLIVPVDRCYELVGVVRTHWVGLAGGREVWERIEAWFDEVVTGARVVGGSPAPPLSREA